MLLLSLYFLFFFIALDIDLRIDCETQSPFLSRKVSKYIARTCSQENASNPDKLTGFLRYLKKERKVTVVNIREGSIIFTLECKSQQILDELWEDYCTGHLSEVAQMNLVTKDILKQFDLTSLKLTSNIKEEDYRDCRQRFEGLYGKNVV